jgi:hypothetical protein
MFMPTGVSLWPLLYFGSSASVFGSVALDRFSRFSGLGSCFVRRLLELSILAN